MKAKEFIIETKVAKSVKPRNFVAKNAMKTTSGAGAHKDKKRADKQGNVKHKNKFNYKQDDWSQDFERRMKQGVEEDSAGEELANEVYAEFERMYPNLARRADDRIVHAAIMDVLNYGGNNDPAALAQDVARAVKRNIQSVAEDVVSEKAVSKQQQKFMGMVHAAKKGETPASPEVAKVAAGMSKKAAKDFAATKHKGLPKKKGVSEDQKIAELSSELLGRYKKGASADATAADKKGDYKHGDKRFSGIVKATKKQFANDLKGKK
jgi:hypothetical protein